jgi:hypothetical protein
MHRIIIGQVLLVAGLSAVVVWSPWAGAVQPATPGKDGPPTSEPVAKDGLALTLTAGKATYTTEENVAFTIHLTNKTMNKLYLTHTRSAAWVIRLKETATGKEYRVEHSPIPFGMKGFWPFIELDSSKALDLAHTVSSQLPPPGAVFAPGSEQWYVEVNPAKAGEKLRSLPPGKYTLTVGVQLVQSADKEYLKGGIKGKALTLPLTTMTSNPVTLEIVDKK